MSCTFDHIDRHCDGKNGLHTHFAFQRNGILNGISRCEQTISAKSLTSSVWTAVSTIAWVIMESPRRNRSALLIPMLGTYPNTFSKSYLQSQTTHRLNVYCRSAWYFEDWVFAWVEGWSPNSKIGCTFIPTRSQTKKQLPPPPPPPPPAIGQDQGPQTRGYPPLPPERTDTCENITFRSYNVRGRG